MVSKYLFARLSAAAPVTALLGSAPLRVFPVKAPQRAAYPLVVYSCAIVPSDVVKGTPATRDLYRVTLRIWAPTEESSEAYDTCEDIDAAIRTALDSVTGTAGTVSVDGCQYIGGGDGMDEGLEYFYREANYEIRLMR